jgi:hypothetical protein
VKPENKAIKIKANASRRSAYVVAYPSLAQNACSSSVGV